MCYICAIYTVPTISYMHGNTQFLYIGVDIYKHSLCSLPGFVRDTGEQYFFCAASSVLPGPSAHFLLRALQCSV